MLTPTSQDSSLRDGSPDEGFDRGVLQRWRDALTGEQVERVRAHTWRLSRALGYPAEEATAGALERASVAVELRLLGAGIALMRSGFYPFGAVGVPRLVGSPPGASL